MVNVEKYKPKEFTGEDSETANPTNYPKGALTIMRADEVEIKSGFSMGQEKLVLEVVDTDGKRWTYWPNKTSIAALAAKFGNETDKWTDNSFELTQDTVRVRGQKKLALFVKD